jgi:pimeloyl-ACP methyl ester carboxylesterase
MTTGRNLESNEGMTMAEPTYLLVHGAWHGAWCWQHLGTELDARSVRWRAVDLPSSQRGGDPKADLAQDAAVVAEASELDGPTILVGHSYAGAVIAEAAHLITGLEKLIYVAALVPLVGQSATDASREVKVRTELDEAIGLEGELLILDAARAPSALYQDCTPDLQAWALAQLSTQTLASFRSARRGPDVAVPSTYVLCRDDHAIDPSLQQKMAERTSRVIEVEGGHCPFLARPSALADALLS